MFAIIISAIDGTWSVRETINRIVADNRDDIVDIIMAIVPRTTPACRAVIEEMKEKYPGLVRQHEQCRLPGVGGAIQECADLVDAPWTVLMASDLETPPETLQRIIARAKVGDVDVVTSSRWLEGGDLVIMQE